MHETQTETSNSISPTPEKGAEAVSPTGLEGTENEAQRTLRIKTLNDAFRSTFLGGRVVMTEGVHSFMPIDQYEIIKKVHHFKDFSDENDPHGEHDFGSFQHKDQRVFWKIDYYNHDLSGGSEDPTDPSITNRVLTIILAHEY